MGTLFVYADACPVKAEAERVATQHGWRMLLVSNGGIRPSANPLVESVFVAEGPDFRRGMELPPFDNVDVYPLLARLLGIAPLANDGEIAPLLPALRP